VNGAEGRPAPEVLIPESEIRARIDALAAEISEDYAGKQVHLVGVLKGAFVFLADLARRLSVPCVVDFIAVSSYGGGVTTTGAVRLLMDVRAPIEGRHVIVVEDIVDSGHTLHYLTSILGARSPASLAACTLLHKPGHQQVEVDVKYVGFEIPDVWVVGYGLDLAEDYRTLPYIGTIAPDETP
jgi:hypoxanthine phosphoribosyltransferase